MRIVIIDENKVVNYAGGIEKIICGFANEFTKRGHDVSIVCMDEEAGVPFFGLDKKVNFVNLGIKTDFYEGFFDYKWQLKKIQREISKLWDKKHNCKKDYFFRGFIQRLDVLIKHLQPDVIIAIDSDTAMMAHKCSNLGDIPVVAMCHIVPNSEHFSAEQIAALQKCKVVQVLQPGFVAQMYSLGVENVTIIPNCVKQIPCDDIKNKDNKTIIIVARIEPVRKRQHLAIRAFSNIAGKYPEWKLEMYGSVGNKTYYKQLQKLITEEKLDSQVSIKGPVNNILQVYQQADILVSTSDYEGFGLSVVEAMSAGLPVIAFRECYPDNYIIAEGQTGLLCDTSIEAMSKSMDTLMSSYELRVQYGKNAHEYAKKFAPDNIWDKWESLLHECVEERIKV